MTKKEKSEKPRHKIPVLLIGWGREVANDVAYAREKFHFDKGLDCLDAQGAINEDVLGAIEDWLKETRMGNSYTSAAMATRRDCIPYTVLIH